MARDKITEITIEGMRSIEKLTLKLDGLTVLIGDNGSGKSSIVEACEILRRASAEGFFSDFHQIHGGLYSLLRHGAKELRLGVRVDGDGPPLRYEFAVTKRGVYSEISDERLELGPSADQSEATQRIDRRHNARRKGASEQLALSGGVTTGLLDRLNRTKDGSYERARRALANIEVHVPFELTPSWVAQADNRKSEARGEMLLQRVDRLERLGKNLPNVYQALRNEFGAEHWRETLDCVRLGLGHEVEDIVLRAGASGGIISLWLKLEGHDEPIQASGVSDGMLAYLSFVALYRLPRPDRTLLVFDEPDLHLHPGLVGRTMQFLETIAEDHPVLLTTHSDHVLDGLESPEKSVGVCELDLPDRRTRIGRLDREALDLWLADYRGIGEIRSAGYLRQLLADSETTAEGAHHGFEDATS